MITVISLGGSIVAPDGVDTGYLKEFRVCVREYLAEDARRRLILVIGGGAPARRYQAAYREISERAQSDAQDWIGIAATRLNGELVRGLFPEECLEALVTNPGEAVFTGRILVAAGWKPGFSSDYDAVFLAEKFGAATVINLSNISRVYTADPRLDPGAKPLDRLTWAEFRAIVGDEWTPGRNAPFDPVAAKKASELKMKVIVAAGKDLDTIASILRGKPFSGTTIGD
ncbi:MAG: UMP kinase [Spirochaetales bacterium]|jgi:uridylate kinase|nr:UMP kinase [Spirochaetales bacterium]